MSFAARQELGFQVVEVELNEFLELGLDGVFIAGLLEIAKPGGVIDGLHLDFGVQAFLAVAQAGVADVRGDNFKLPRGGMRGLGKGMSKGSGLRR